MFTVEYYQVEREAREYEAEFMALKLWQEAQDKKEAEEKARLEAHAKRNAKRKAKIWRAR